MKPVCTFQSESNVEIAADAQRVMYVASYPGFSTQDDVVKHATDLFAVRCAAAGRCRVRVLLLLCCTLMLTLIFFFV